MSTTTDSDGNHPEPDPDPHDRHFPDFATHPHDAFTKYALSDPRRAESLFRSQLPATIASQVDWSTLTLLPSSFVDSDLRETRADLLFTARCRDQRELQLYLLLENQSTTEPAMALRLLGYTLQIYQRHFNTHGLPLVPVIPFVLHQGPDPWNVSIHLADLYATPAGLDEWLLPYLPSFQYLLNDLTRFAPESMEHDRALQAILQLMKMARQRDVDSFLNWLADGWNEALSVAVSNHLTRIMLTYCLHLDEHLDLAAIQRSLQGNPHLQQQAMTLAEKLKTEGRQEGMQQGRREGRIVALQKSVLDVLTLRFDRMPSGLRDHIQAIHDPDRLEQLHKSAVRAASLEEFARSL